MGGDYPITQIGDVASSISATHEFGKEKLVFLNTSDILHGRFLHRTYSSVKDWPGQAKKSIRKNDILFSEIRPANGRWAFVEHDAEDFVVSTKLMVIRARPDRLFPKFLYQFLTSADTTTWLQHLAESRSGTFPQITFDQVATLKLPLPPLAEQHAIAAIIGALDDKIELNRQMNATLEAMARALFQSWFVDFDPVRAKFDGRLPGALDPATAALFPASFHDSELGPIPFGWNVAKLKDLTSKIGSGATPRGGSEVYVDEGPALIRSQNVYDHEFHWAGLARLTDESATELENVAVMKNDVLLNITGDSILRTCVVDPAVLPARVNQHVAIIRAIAGVPPRYLHLYLVQGSVKSSLIGMSAGATRHAITKGHLEATAVLKPSAAVLAVFDTLTAPWFARIDANRTHSRTLAKLRDTLLPKLLSGELSVAGLESTLAGAVADSATAQPRTPVP